MRSFLAGLGALFVLGTGIALAGDPPAEKADATDAAEAAAPAAEAVEAADAAAPDVEEELPDCTALEGDELTTCEAKVAEITKLREEAAKAAEAAKAGKAGKAKRSNTNRMESEFTDE